LKPASALAVARNKCSYATATQRKTDDDTDEDDDDDDDYAKSW